MRIIDEEHARGLPGMVLDPKNMRAATSALATKILKLLAQGGMHSSEIAKTLHEQEQKIYYHTRKLREAGIIQVDRLEDTSGGTAKVLRLASPAFFVHFKEMEAWQPKRARKIPFLNPFVKDGRWNARIVVGSPHPHGPESARGRDASYAIDLALFLGQYLETPPTTAVLHDTDLTSWQQNLIIVGGPVVNKAADKVNSHSPVQYDKELKAFRSRKGTYGQEHAGLIVKMPNPYAKNKWIILIAGKRFTGTRAAILTFLQRFDTLSEKKGATYALVQGLDMDSDGTIDAVKILEVSPARARTGS